MTKDSYLPSVLPEYPAKPITAPAWKNAPTAPGDYVLRLKSGMEMQEGITQQEIDSVSSWPGDWYGPIPACPERIAE